MTASPLVLPVDAPVSGTVYSMIWPETEALIRATLTEELETLMGRHTQAHTKRQDAMHGPFFEAWRAWVAPCLRWNEDQFPEQYPCAGSSEAIREIIRSATWKQQDLVLFEGDYEGYDVIAAMQGTTVHRVPREQWRQVVMGWLREGAPWGDRSAQWWVSQPSAIDGQVWGEFHEWLGALETLAGCQVWLDACYIGLTATPTFVDVRFSSVVAGIVFSLSKVMGAYYRRIGGCWAREAQPGLWGNRWFKNLDSLYLGERFLTMSGNAAQWGQRHALRQEEAFAAVIGPHQGAWADLGISWKSSDVVLLMHATTPDREVPDEHPLAAWWATSRRGQARAVSRRLCLTPTLDRLQRAERVS